MSREAYGGLAGQGCFLHLRLVGQSAPADVVRKTGAGWVRTVERWGIEVGGTPRSVHFCGHWTSPPGAKQRVKTAPFNGVDAKF
jgi:hypothetical protein